MGVRNKQGGNKAKGMARGKTKKREVAEKCNTSTEMFGRITLIAGPTFKIMCSDGHERTAKAPGFKGYGKFSKGGYVKVDTTDKHFCRILCHAKPNEEAVDSLKKESGNNQINFSTANDEFAGLIELQNEESNDDEAESEEDNDTRKNNDYSNIMLIKEENYDDDDDYYEEEEEEEVDKWGNTIPKNKDTPKVIEEKKEDEEIIVNQKSLKKNQDDDEIVSNKKLSGTSKLSKPAKKQKHVVTADNYSSNSDNNTDPDLDNL